MSTLNSNPTIQKLSICMMGVKTNFPLHRLSSLFCVRISDQYAQWVQILSEIALLSSCILQLNKAFFFKYQCIYKIFFVVKAHKKTMKKALQKGFNLNLVHKARNLQVKRKTTRIQCMPPAHRPLTLVCTVINPIFVDGYS